MNSYTPHPSHLFIPSLFFGLWSICLFKGWDPFAWTLLALGLIATFIISWALVWEVLIRKTDAIRFLFDSAKYLDRDRTSDLLSALGLKPLPPIQKTTTVVVQKKENGGITRQTTYHDIPASPMQLEQLAIGLLQQDAPFSRREWTGERERIKVFTQDEFNTLAEYCDRKKLRARSEGANSFEPTEELIQFLQAYLPSPTPQMETA